MKPFPSSESSLQPKLRPTIVACEKVPNRPLHFLPGATVSETGGVLCDSCTKTRSPASMTSRKWKKGRAAEVLELDAAIVTT